MTSDEQPKKELKRNVRKLDGSGRGIRANAGRGGCDEPRPYGKRRR